jgi:hypothetical protein
VNSSPHLPPDRGCNQPRWRDWLTIAVLSVIVIIAGIGSCKARGEDKDETKAKGALALAKAKRERETSKAAAAEASCHTDLAKAEAEVEKSGKRLVLWVGVTCSEHPELRKLLDNAVHCRLDKWRTGDDEPRIVIRGGDAIEYFVYPRKMTSETRTAENIKKAWARTYVPPPDPPKRAGISEELSRKKAAGPCTLCGPGCDCGPGCVCDQQAAKRKAAAAKATTHAAAAAAAPVLYQPVYYQSGYTPPAIGTSTGVRVGLVATIASAACGT